MRTFEHPPCGDNLKTKLIDILTGQHYPSKAEQREMASHFMGCASCQAELKILLHALNQNVFMSRVVGMSQPLHTMLVQFSATLDELHLHESLARYLEVLDTSGEATAAEWFPNVARHLARCAHCRAEVMVAHHLMRSSRATKRTSLCKEYSAGEYREA